MYTFISMFQIKVSVEYRESNIIPSMPNLHVTFAENNCVETNWFMHIPFKIRQKKGVSYKMFLNFFLKF